MKHNGNNCEHIQSHIDDYLDGDCSADQTLEIETHIEQCVHCQSVLAEEKSFRDMLRGLPVPPPTEGFVDRALKTAETQQQLELNASTRSKRHGFVWGFSSAMAAGFALWMVVSLFPSSELSQMQESEIHIALHETHQLRLAFNAKSDVKNATISIELPENVVLDGYPGEGSLAWQTDLAKGDNTLTLPIRAEQLNHGVLVAKVKYSDQIKTIKVNLRVTKPGMSNLWLAPDTNA